MSGARQRGLLRLGILLASLAGLAVIGYSVSGGSGNGGGSASSGSGESPAGVAPPASLAASVSRARLPAPLHGEALVSQPGGLLVVGGADRGDTSLDTVSRFDPATGRVTAAGSLAEPLHDLAVAALSGHVYAFGGGAASTVDTVQELPPGGRGQVIGHMPSAVSDLSAVAVAGGIYVVGGFDERSPVASVLETTNARAFTRVARLPTPVRYTAVATVGDKIYAFGGETANGQDTSEIQEYDIGTERSVIAGHLPEPVAHAAAIRLGGAIFLLGGRRSGSASDRILRFDPSRNIGIPVGRLPMPVFDGAAATLGSDGYLMGGLGASNTALDSIVTLRPVHRGAPGA